MVNGRCRMHGGASPGAPRGNANARRHGLYTAEAIAKRRELAALLRSMRGLVKEAAGHQAWPASTVTLGLAHPMAQRLGRAADLLGHRPNRRPLRLVLVLVVEHPS